MPLSPDPAARIQQDHPILTASLAPLDETITIAELTRDPYPIYRRLRREAPVLRVKSVGRTFLTSSSSVSTSSASKELAAKSASFGTLQAGAVPANERERQRSQQPAPPRLDPAPSVAMMARQLADTEQEIDKLKTLQAQTTIENSELDKHLKEAQELARDNADLIKDLKSAQSRITQDNADLSAQVKASQEQVTHLAAQVDASQTQTARIAAQIKASQDQITRLVEQKQRSKPSIPASLPASSPTKKPLPDPSCNERNRRPGTLRYILHKVQ